MCKAADADVPVAEFSDMSTVTGGPLQPSAMRAVHD
jgi:hypothetical protein